MARGPRKTIDEKIAAKEEMIEALMNRVESERQELQELVEQKRRRELEAVGDLIEESGLSPEEVAGVLQQYLENRDAMVS